MPRDGSGNYTLPSGNPVSAGATIESNWANSTMDDLAVAMTDSLSRSGSGSMLVPFQNIDGAETLPGITWAQEPSTGFFRQTTGDMRWSILSVAQGRFNNTKQIEVFRDGGFRAVLDDFTAQTVVGDWTIDGTWTFNNAVILNGISFTDQALGDDGSEALPTYSYTSDPTTGIYLAGAGVLGFTTSGIERLELQDTQAIINVPFYGADGSVGTPQWSFTNDAGMGMYRAGAGLLNFAISGVQQFSLTAAGAIFTPILQAPTGSAAAPGYTFTADITTGLFYTTEFGPAGVAFAAGGVQQANFNTTAAFFANPVRGPDGTEALPTFAFTNDTTSGMFLAGAAVPGISAGGVTAISFRAASGNKGIFAGVGVPFQADGNLTTAALPGYTFSNDTDSGFYRATTNSVSVAVGGVTALNFDAGTLAIWAGAGFRIRGDPAAANAPSFSFTNDTDLGMYRVGTNVLGLTAGGSPILQVNKPTSSVDLLQDTATTGVTINFKNSAGITAWNIAYEGTSGFQPKQFSISFFNSTTGAFISIPLYIAVTGRVHTALPILSP